MSSRFEFTVSIEAERMEGKFAGRDELSGALMEMLEGANEGSIDGVGADGSSTYEIQAWDINEESVQPMTKRNRINALKAQLSALDPSLVFAKQDSFGRLFVSTS
jgi:hypothetical protein